MPLSDPMLVALLCGLEDGCIKALPVTLNVHGCLVTGVMCSREEYMMEAEAYVSGRVGLNAGQAISALHNFIKDPEGYGAGKGDKIEQPGEFVHVKNASFLSSSWHLTIGGVPWRGRLSSIDAWFLEILQPEPT